MNKKKTATSGWLIKAVCNWYFCVYKTVLAFSVSSM